MEEIAKYLGLTLDQFYVFAFVFFFVILPFPIFYKRCVGSVDCSENAGFFFKAIIPALMLGAVAVAILFYGPEWAVWAVILILFASMVLK